MPAARSTSNPRVESPAKHPLAAGGGPGPRPLARASLLYSLFGLLEARGIAYCILHDAEELPGGLTSDVDCILPANTLPVTLATLLRQERTRLGGVVVQWLQHETTAHYLVLATEGSAPREFLALDVSSDYRRNGRVFYSGEEILASRCRGKDFWTPAPAIEFGCYLVKKVAKRSLGEEHGRRLTRLYRRDPVACERAVARFWQGAHHSLLLDCARSGAWNPAVEQLTALRRELVRPATLAAVGAAVRYWSADAARRLQRWRQPTGVHLVCLGPDGAGKSTTLSGLGAELAPAFRRIASHHLAPHAFRPAAAAPVAGPQGRRPRTLLGSLAKLAYWTLDYTMGYAVTIRPALARSTLVLFDRYLLDAFVDPRRYRYAGPLWALRALWSVVPKPDLVVLLDAPTTVLRGRKQEVPPDETERQRQAYRSLVGTLPNGHVVEAAQPLEGVVHAMSSLVLDFMAARAAGRLMGVTALPGPASP